MKILPLMNQPISQVEFAEMVGISEPRVSQLMSDGALSKGASAHELLLAYCERLREQAAARLGSDMEGLDVVQESAKLKRSQREAQDLKNQVSRGEFAPIGLLSDVLGLASSAVVDRFDQLEGALRKSCPGIDDDVLTTVLNVVTSARNEWIRSTAKLASRAVDRLAISVDEDEDDSDLDDEEADA